MLVKVVIERLASKFADGPEGEKRMSATCELINSGLDFAESSDSVELWGALEEDDRRYYFQRVVARYFRLT